MRRGANISAGVEIQSNSPTQISISLHHIGQIESRRFHYPADLSHTLNRVGKVEREERGFHTRMDTRKNFVVGTLPMS